MRDPSPWVRAAAAETAGERLDRGRGGRAARGDPRSGAPAAGARRRRARRLAASAVPGGRRAELEAATRELEASLTARPDDFASQCDLGRLSERRGDTARAIAAYEVAARLRPDLTAPLVNVSLLYNKVGRNSDAETALRRALVIDPRSAAAHLNLGLLLGELGRFPEAEAALRAAFEEDPAVGGGCLQPGGHRRARSTRRGRVLEPSGQRARARLREVRLHLGVLSRRTRRPGDRHRRARSSARRAAR